MLRLLTAGESHGPALVALLDGMVAGVPVSAEAVASELARRRLGHGRGARMAVEEDRIEILGGVRHGRTLGSPVAIVVHNSEWPKWRGVMAVEEAEALLEEPALTRPRPGHADLAGMLKYGFEDARPVLERASARETVARVAAGAVCKSFVAACGVRVLSHVVAIGGVVSREERLPAPGDLERIDASPVRCVDDEAARAMVALIDETRRRGDTLGGVVEVLAHGVPAGLGSHVQWDRRIDAALAEAMMSIPAIKGVEIGPAFALAARPGSEAHDAILWSPGRSGGSGGSGGQRGPGGALWDVEQGPEPPGRSGRGYERPTARSGGTEGGITTGAVLRVRAAMKPLSSLARPLATVDVATKEAAEAITQRSDVCAVPAAAVVGEAMVAFVLAGALLEKFGGDSLAETRRNLDASRPSL
ncbi:MAG: chorismate synthase [Acidobacteria bacterium]|nr:chorismate synthase [Acidobacteriota bacterium]